MDSRDGALVIAGIIGCVVAAVHGFLVQRVLVRPVLNIPLSGFGATNKRLTVALLHFSTFNWFVGGIALLVSAFFFAREARLATGVLVGTSYLFGALGNLWSLRRLHPGWILYGMAVYLIGYGIIQH